MGEITRYLAEELETILDSSKNEKVVKKFGKDILLSNIPTINKQLKNYEEAAVDSIQQEIYEELIDEQDYSRAEHILSLQSSRVQPIIPRRQLLKCKYRIPQLDPNDYDMFMKSEIDLDELRSRYESVITKVHLFNKKMLEWKNELKHELERSLSGFLCGYQHSSFKSFKDYYKNALETILEFK